MFDPVTSTEVSPVTQPELGLRLITSLDVWYVNATPELLYCSPFNVTSSIAADTTPDVS
jgi:hypothetical protein